jgi:hypothetical protein
MRTRSVSKIFSLALAIAAIAAVQMALVQTASAARHHYTRPPADACLFHRHISAAGTFCSYQCNPNGLGCLQQVCTGGHWSQALPCLRPFCLQSCG